MKTQRLLPLFLGVVLALFTGCAMLTPHSGPKAVVGTWTNGSGTVWMIHSDGTFDADLNHDGKRDASGKYSVSGNTITLWRIDGVNPKGCDGKGVYHFTRTSDSLKFQLVKDGCKLREKNVLMAWRKK